MAKADKTATMSRLHSAARLARTALAARLLAHGFYAGQDQIMLALDRGSGMVDPGRCMQDGYSTAGSPGNGLGAVARLADITRIYSRPGQGSAILARFVNAPGTASQTLLGATLAPYPGERVCGDNWSWSSTARGRTLMLVDGSGHGAEAARAAEIAVRSFNEHADAACEDIVERLHRALAATRGAALAVARIDTAARVVRYR